MPSSGGTVDIEWDVASVTVPMSRVELIVNGEIKESKAVDSKKASGSWRFKAEKSSWVALLVRGNYPDKPEIIVHTDQQNPEASLQSILSELIKLDLIPVTTLLP